MTGSTMRISGEVSYLNSVSWLGVNICPLLCIREAYPDRGPRSRRSFSLVMRGYGTSRGISGAPPHSYLESSSQLLQDRYKHP